MKCNGVAFGEHNKIKEYKERTLVIKLEAHITGKIIHIYGLQIFTYHQLPQRLEKAA